MDRQPDEPQQIVHNHYEQRKNGDNGMASKFNSAMLACLLAIMGFMGIQLWQMNGRMAAFEATLTLMVQRSGIAVPPP
jgi:hypothetical protein